MSHTRREPLLATPRRRYIVKMKIDLLALAEGFIVCPSFILKEG